MPPWMRQIQTAQQQGQSGYGMGANPGGPMGGAPGGQQAPMGGYPGAPQPPSTFSVGSLVSEDALPSWIRAGSDGPGASTPQGGQPGAFGPGASQWGQMAPPNAAAGGWGAPAPGWGASPPSPPAGGQPFQAGAGFGAPGGLSGSALFDDAALPEWLRNAAADQSAGGMPPYAPQAAQPGMSGGFPRPPQQPQSVFMPSGMSAQAPGMPAGGYGAPTAGIGNTPAPGTMPASSLLDASALPTWLGGSGMAPAPAGPAPALGGDGVSVHSLIDERSLPIWLRQEPATPAVEPPPAGSISQWLAAPVTDEPLPTWLNQVYSSAQVPRMEAEPPVNEPWTASHAAVPPSGPPAWYRPAAGSAQLADDREMPPWQAGPGAPPSPMLGGPPSPPGAAGGFGYFGGGMGAAGGQQEARATQGYGEWSGDLSAQAGSGPAGYAGPPSPALPAESAPDEPVAAFSASDLIDPDALPAWVQQEARHEEPTFSSAAGWTSKSRSMEAAGAAPADVPVPALSASMRAQGPMMAQGRDIGEANLPPWLQQGAPPSAMPLSGPYGSGGRSPAPGAIPDAELPPWLRGGGDPGAGRGRQPMGAAPPQQWGGANAGYGAPQAAPGWGGPMGSPPRDQGPVQHYADLFADERPGANRRFSYDMDHSAQPGYPDADGDPFDDNWEEQPRAKTRRRWFGKR